MTDSLSSTFNLNIQNVTGWIFEATKVCFNRPFHVVAYKTTPDLTRLAHTIHGSPA
jgi:hypothetical protein